MIKNHGVEKILCASDIPWNVHNEYIERFKQLDGLSDIEKEMILGTNAQKLLFP